MSEELKACPFCGSKDVVINTDNHDWYIFQCQRCECIYQTSYGTLDKQAKSLSIKDWNSRPIENELRAENERLKAENQRYKDADTVRERENDPWEQ